MTPPAMTDAIRGALFDPDPRESVRRVKEAVANELTAFDRTATAKFTPHFNHTFSPDLELSWPDGTSRAVFLRTSPNSDELAEDLSIVDGEGHLIVGLVQPHATARTASLSTALDRFSGMYTEPDAIESALATRGQTTAFGMVSNALAQGGRGVLADTEITRVVDTVSDGISGAKSTSVSVTRDAIEELELVMAGPQAARMTRVLQAVWEGSDGSLANFPGPPDLSGRIGLESLKYLVRYVNADDPDFWRRVGRKVTLAHLRELDFDLDSSNLQQLINANLDVIVARHTVLKNDPMNLPLESARRPPRWSRRAKRLCLEIDGHFLIFGDTRDDLSHVATDPPVTVDADALARRVGSLKIAEVKFDQDVEHMSFSTEDLGFSAERIRQFSVPSFARSTIRSVVVRTPSGRASIDLQRRTATGVTRSNVLAADLARAVIRLASGLDDSVVSEIEEFLVYTAKSDGETLEDV